MNLDIGARVTLNNGVKIPLLGLGTWSATGRKGRQAVLWALEAGYRLIDTAASYGNESEVGEAVRASGLTRGEVFVTTKVWPSDFGYERTLAAFEESRRRLGFEQVDLYLLHWPGEDARRRAESWRALETLLADGRCRAIGVSNYDVPELEEVLDAGRGSTVPAINQISLSPFSQARGVQEFCRARGIRVEGYSPLTRGERFGAKTLLRLARAHERTPAQVLIRWALQKEIVTIPKSVSHEHIFENANIFNFSLAAEDMASLDALDKG